MRRQNLFLAIIVLILSVFLIGQGKNLNNLKNSCREEDLKNLEVKKIEVLGDPEAPVLIEIYSDYQCVFGARYFRETIMPVIDEYINTGKARLVYHNLAFEGQRSQITAEAAYCANDQGKFWQYHQEILNETYQQQGEIDIYNLENLKNIAKKIELDICEFSACLDSGKYAGLVKEQTRKGFIEKDINSPLATFLNNKKIVDEQGQNLGAMSYNQLKEKIKIFTQQ
jgi:protein-disulfide isomerase